MLFFDLPILTKNQTIIRISKTDIVNCQVMKKLFFLFVLGLILSLGITLKYLNQKVHIKAIEFSLEPITIAIISDLNSQYGATEYEPEVKRAISLITEQWQPDLVLGGGDAIAGQKQSLTEAQIKAMWQAFDNIIALPLRKAKIPYAFTIGNHDGSGAIKNQQFVFAQERNLAATYWNDPQHNSGIDFVDRANFPFYYTFQQKNIFYLVWDASTNIIDAQQLAWIEQSLNSKMAQQAAIRIAIGHLPLYAVTEAKNKPGEYLAEAEKLRSLLSKYRVHTYISGHHHAYYPGKKGLLQLLHAGALGQGARQLIGSELLPRQTVTLMKINPISQITAYTTYDLKTLATIKNSELPRFIVSQNGLILRNDISLIDLTTLEKQSCLQKLKQKLCQA